MYHTRNLRTSSLRVIVKPVYLADTSPCSATRLTRNPYCANVYTSLAARLAKREEAACLFMIIRLILRYFLLRLNESVSPSPRNRTKSVSDKKAISLFDAKGIPRGMTESRFRQVILEGWRKTLYPLRREQCIYQVNFTCQHARELLINVTSHFLALNREWRKWNLFHFRFTNLEWFRDRLVPADVHSNARRCAVAFF